MYRRVPLRLLADKLLMGCFYWANNKKPEKHQPPHAACYPRYYASAWREAKPGINVKHLVVLGEVDNETASGPVRPARLHLVALSETPRRWVTAARAHSTH